MHRARPLYASNFSIKLLLLAPQMCGNVTVEKTSGEALQRPAQRCQNHSRTRSKLSRRYAWLLLLTGEKGMGEHMTMLILHGPAGAFVPIVPPRASSWWIPMRSAAKDSHRKWSEVRLQMKTHHACMVVLDAVTHAL